MASNLTTIGLTTATEAEFDALMQRLAAAANQRLACDPGDYAIWRSQTGAELWFHITGQREADGHLIDHEIIGFTPFFEGESDVDIEIDALFQRPGDNPFEGAFKGWVAPGVAGTGVPGTGGGTGVHPIIFDCLDFAANRDRALPFRCHAKLSAFARTLAAYPDEDAYYASQTTGDLEFGARAFVPGGLFRRDQAGAPTSDAELTGTVVEHRMLGDAVDGRSVFHWLLVDSLGATFDVVADPAVVTGDIVEGGTVHLSCVMFGRLID